MSGQQNLMKILVGDRFIPVQDAIVCPLTGQVLLRSEERAVQYGLNSAMYVAKEIPAPKKDDDALPARPATMVDREVDPEILR